MKWQPIETAPKDGSFVLLKGGTTTEHDYNKEGVETSRPVVAKWENYENALLESSWVFCYWDGAWRTSYENPTHWAKL